MMLRYLKGMINRIMKTYSELIQFSTFEDRFNYLKLHGNVGEDTFGFERYLNQKFYKSKEWKHIRDIVILRDQGCDLACLGHDIYGKVIIHHMNPITISDLETNPDIVLNPEYLICVSQETHNALHYGDGSNLHKYDYEDRQPNDTSPWRR